MVGAAGTVPNSTSQLACLGTSRDSQTSHLPLLTDLPLDHHIAQLVSGPAESRQGPTAGLPHGQTLDPTSRSRFLQAACRERRSCISPALLGPAEQQRVSDGNRVCLGPHFPHPTWSQRHSSCLSQERFPTLQ